MTVPASHCEAKLHGFRRTADGVVVSFVLHPAEVPQALALDPLGTRYMLALCAIGDDEQPVSSAGTSTHQQKGSAATVGSPGKDAPKLAGEHKSPAERAVIRAALLPRDRRFQAWVSEQWGGREIGEAEAAVFIRSHCCDAKSRALIADEPDYLERFLALETSFRMDVGELARPR